MLQFDFYYRLLVKVDTNKYWLRFSSYKLKGYPRFLPLPSTFVINRTSIQSGPKALGSSSLISPKAIHYCFSHYPFIPSSPYWSTWQQVENLPTYSWFLCLIFSNIPDCVPSSSSYLLFPLLPQEAPFLLSLGYSGSHFFLPHPLPIFRLIMSFFALGVLQTRLCQLLFCPYSQNCLLIQLPKTQIWF